MLRPRMRRGKRTSRGVGKPALSHNLHPNQASFSCVLVMTGSRKENRSPALGKWVARRHELWSSSGSESETVLDGEMMSEPEQPPDGLGTSAKHADTYQLFRVRPEGPLFPEQRQLPQRLFGFSGRYP